MTLRDLLSGLFQRRVAAPAGAAVILAAVAFVGPWEGERTEAYLDRIASPPVWTVCYGETRGVQAGDSYTPDQCAAMLAEALAVYRDELVRWDRAGGVVVRGLTNRRTAEHALCVGALE